MCSIRLRARFPLFCSFLALFTQVPRALPVVGQTVSGDYNKTFYANVVDERAKILAGALVQTWASAGKNSTVEAITIKEADPNANPPVQAVLDYYRHCLQQTSKKTGKFNTGFPLADTNALAPVGYNDNIETSDRHQSKNTATATVDVKPRDTVPGSAVRVRRPGGVRATPLFNFVKVNLSGTAKAGVPTDGDMCHSADSHAGAEIEAQEVFREIMGGQRPLVEVVGQNVMNGGSRGTLNSGISTDPYFVTVRDLDTTDVFREVVMVQDLEWADATYSLDDTGIRLTIDRNDPDSFVSLLFDSTLSSWVVEPYTYGARLDNTGFTAYGETPLAGWSITTTVETIEAFFDFGPDGQPFDYVQVNPNIPFMEGHEYAYDVGAGDGVWVIASVPEPNSVLLAALACVVLAQKVRRGYLQAQTEPLSQRREREAI